MRFFRSLLAVAALAACNDASAPVAPGQMQTGEASSALLAGDGSIPGHYIVVADWNASVPDIVAQYGIAPRHVYEHLLNGFSGAFPSSVAEALATDPRVLKVSVQRQMKAVETVNQAGATWGLDRIDQRALPLNQTYSYDFTGEGVRAYIIDTGIRTTHSEFEGRASIGFNVFASDPTDPLLGYGGGDCEGHGTHVSGTVGGKTYGVAKKVTLIGVRVLNCVGYGSDADVIAGMEWVAANATLPAVANMSLGDVVPTKTLGTSSPVDDAVKAIVASGVTLAVAAGNGWGNGTVGADACMFPISNVPEAITVAASSATDARTSWTNYGACIDLFAPGSSIMSATFDDDNSSGTKSGTSMASPHVAGAAALVLQQAPGLTPAEVRDYLVSQSTKNIITPVTLNSGHTMNSHLLYSRTTVTADVRGKPPKNPRPCTPKRQRAGEC